VDRLRVLASRVFGLFGKRNSDEDFDAEVCAHLQLLTDDNIRRGMNPAEARCAARREFGGVEQTKEAYRHLFRTFAMPYEHCVKTPDSPLSRF